MIKSKTGIVVEILSKKKCLGKTGEDYERRWLNDSDGHITHCIVLPRGCAFDNIMGLGFQIDADTGDKKENIFFLGWDQILEVRLLDGRPIYRNRYLCPTCRRITKTFLDSGPFCKHCESSISTTENREACISPYP